jgi:recombination protein RecT
MANYSMRKVDDPNEVAKLTKETALAVSNQIKKNKEVLMRSCPKGFNFDRMTRTVINAISTTPQLAKCSPASLFLSSVKAFTLGLEPNGALSEGYLVPFWNTKKGMNEAQFMPSYRGLQNLARRSGEVTAIYSKAVYEKDVFEVEEGTERKIIHKPDYTKDRGQAVCYYAVFILKTGEIDFEVMSINEINSIRARSKSAESGPWVTDYDEMAKKTVMKRLLKRSPMSIELADAVSLENSASMGENQNLNDIIDIDGLEVDNTTSEDMQTAINAEKAEELKTKIKTAQEEKANVNSAPTDDSLNF